jgi:hypothetical protein
MIPWIYRPGGKLTVVMDRFLYSLAVVVGFLTVLNTVRSSGRSIRAPCVFGRDDAEMHKYSAVLAATEPFKESCKSHILQSVNPIRRLAMMVGGEQRATSCNFLNVA